MKHTRARIPTSIALWLSIGLLITLALAWTLALAMPIPQYPRLHARMFVIDGVAWTVATNSSPGAIEQWWGAADDSELQGASPEDWIKYRAVTLAQDKPGGQERTIMLTRPSWGTLASHGPYPDTRFGSDTGFGLPFPALWFQVVGTVRGNTITNDQLHGGILVAGSPSSRAHDFRALPLKVSWSGLIADVLVWGLSLWAIAFLWRFNRQRRRRLKGRCLACGYDLRADYAAGCSECGWNRPAATARADEAARTPNAAGAQAREAEGA